MQENIPVIEISDAPPPDAAPETAAAAWTGLFARIQRVTPKMVVRFALVVGLLALVGWLIANAWVALLPFLIGGSIAYALLPLVNRLDRYLPRIVAVVIALAPVVAFGVLFVWLLVPISLRQFSLLASNLPGEPDVQTLLVQVREYVATLPPSAQTTIYNAVTQANTVFATRSGEISTQIVNFVLNSTIGLVNTLGFLLGFVIVPAWVLTVLSEQPNASRAMQSILPKWMQGDAWAFVRILDRSFGWFLRGQVLLGMVAAVLVYVGLEILVRIVGVGRESNLNYQLFLALFAGLMQLIPFIGPILGALPAVLLGFTLSPQLGVGAIVVFVLVQMILDNIVTPQLQGRIAGMNRNLLILVIIAVSQINFWLVLVAAPIAGVIYDLFRYLYGRFGDPPRPAGVIPGDTAWKLWSPKAIAAFPGRTARAIRSMNPPRAVKE